MVGHALLAEAGWTDTNGNGTVDKDGVEFEVDLVYSKLVDLWSNAALIMQDQLSQIGIKINIVEQEWSAYLGNVLLPGKFDTDRIRTNITWAAKQSGRTEEAVRAERMKANPAGRFGTPEEFGAACAFLCSGHAGFVTGQNFLMDGGQYPGTF